MNQCKNVQNYNFRFCLQTFYAQISIYVIICLRFYMRCVDVQYLPEDDQDDKKKSELLQSVCKNIILTLLSLLVLLYAMF